MSQIGFLRIPPNLTPDEWLHNWQGLHTTVAIETQATFGYTPEPRPAAQSTAPSKSTPWSRNSFRWKP